MLCCIVLNRVVSYRIVSYCIVMYFIVFNCIALCCIVLYCIVLYCIVLYCIVLYCIVLCAFHRIVLNCILFYSIGLNCVSQALKFFDMKTSWLYRWSMTSQNHIDHTHPEYQVELLDILKSNTEILKVQRII